MKSKTLQFKGFRITGTSDLTLWGGGNASISMNSFFINHLKEMRDKINDGGFGVESINGAICNIYKVYQNGHGEYVEYSKTITIGNVSDSTFDAYYSEG